MEKLLINFKKSAQHVLNNECGMFFLLLCGSAGQPWPEWLSPACAVWFGAFNHGASHLPAGEAAAHFSVIFKPQQPLWNARAIKT